MKIYKTKSLFLKGATGAVALSLSVILAGDPAIAAPTDQVPPSADSTDSSTGGLLEIVVTARRRAESLQDTPLSIQAVTAGDLERMNVVSLSDVNNIANVNFAVQPGFINTLTPFIRGIGQSDPILTDDAPIAVYVDGVLYARQEGINFDLVQPESVQVLRGPQGSLFGRNTTGGAVSITSPLPSDTFSLAGKLGYASNSEWTERAILNTGLFTDAGLKAMLAVEYHSMDGNVRNTLTDDAKHWAGSDETLSTYFTLHGEIGTLATFDLRADYSHSLSEVLSGQIVTASAAELSYFGASPALGGDPFVVSNERLNAIPLSGPLTEGQFGGVSFTLNFPVSDAVNVKSISAYRRLRTSDESNAGGVGFLRGPVIDPVTFAFAGIQRVSPITVESNLLDGNGPNIAREFQVSQEFQFSGQAARNKYVGGVYAFYEQTHESLIDLVTIPLPPTAAVAENIFGGFNYQGRSESFAAYASDSYTPPILNDALEFTGGVRYTEDRKALDYLTLPPELPDLPTAAHAATFSDPSGDFTAKYKFTSSAMAYVRFANAYKSGGFSGRDAAAAPGYKPETAHNWEIGTKSDWLDNRIRLNADVFYTIYSNKQISTFAPGLGANGLNASHIVNAGKAVYPGDEIELALLPTPQWRTDISYGHVNPKYKQFLYQPFANQPAQNIASSAKFIYTPRTTYSIGTTYTFLPMSVGELSGTISFDYKSQMYFFATDVFSPLNEALKAGSQNILNANITLAKIPVRGMSDVAVSIYGKNLLNKAYLIQAVDYEIIPGYDNFGTGVFARPVVFGINVSGKY